MADAPGVITLVLADDHALFRDGVRQLLELEPDMQVLGEASDGVEAAAHVARLQPRVLLLDVEMPGIAVTETVARVRAVAPSTAIVVLTMHDSSALVTELLVGGVSGYVLKSVTRLELTGIIRSVAGRPDRVMLSVSRNTLSQTHYSSPPDLLSVREKEVLALAAKARSNVQIAAELKISEATVKRHLYNIFGKLGAVSRIDAVNKFYERPAT